MATTEFVAKETKSGIIEKERLVRCKNCKYWQDQEWGVIEIPVCLRLTERFTGKQGGQFFPMGADDYCSRGELR